MKVYVNDIPVEILPGMTVRHALIGSGLTKDDIAVQKIFDAWGNEIGLDGELADGEKIFVCSGRADRFWNPSRRINRVASRYPV